MTRISGLAFITTSVAITLFSTAALADKLTCISTSQYVSKVSKFNANYKWLTECSSSANSNAKQEYLSEPWLYDGQNYDSLTDGAKPMKDKVAFATIATAYKTTGTFSHTNVDVANADGSVVRFQSTADIGVAGTTANLVEQIIPITNPAAPVVPTSAPNVAAPTVNAGTVVPSTSTATAVPQPPIIAPIFAGSIAAAAAQAPATIPPPPPTTTPIFAAGVGGTSIAPQATQPQAQILGPTTGPLSIGPAAFSSIPFPPPPGPVVPPPVPPAPPAPPVPQPLENSFGTVIGCEILEWPNPDGPDRSAPDMTITPNFAVYSWTVQVIYTTTASQYSFGTLGMVNFLVATVQPGDDPRRALRQQFDEQVLLEVMMNAASMPTASFVNIDQFTLDAWRACGIATYYH